MFLSKFRQEMMKSPILGIVALCLAMTPALSEGVSFEGKTVTMIIGTSAGGGTDVTGRMIAPFLVKYLPGTPRIIVQNVPGANGIVSMNYMANNAALDGLTIIMSATPMADPLNYRTPQAKFDPSTFKIVGGAGRGGSTIVISKNEEKNLYDKSLPPVIMGGVGGVPRSGAMGVAWGIDVLGWNAKWVIGYPGTGDLFLALERGEAGMTASAELSQVEELLATGKFKIMYQTGILAGGSMHPRSEFADIPVLATEVEGKFTSAVQQQGFDYWNALMPLDKWLALPPATPDPIVATYRAAFEQMTRDPEFVAAGRKISEDFEPQSWRDLESLIKILADTSPAALDYIRAMLSRQGLSQ
jgi:tripartite-type tricarboxylate transporter receptor subunit TctC